MQNLHITIKPTKRCNLRCKYCYEQKYHSAPSMLDAGKMRRIMIKIKNYCANSNLRKIRINYTGGEVLLLGFQYWKKILRLQEDILKNSGIKVGTHFQTNLTLLNDEYIKFIKENNIEVGTTIDLFSNARVFRSNRKPIINVFIDKLKMLLKNGLSCALIVMINKQNHLSIKKIYDLLNNIGLPFQTLPLMPDTYNYAPQLAITGKEYGRALIKMLEKHIYTSPKNRLYVRTLESYVKNVKEGKLAKSGSLCIFSKYCLGNQLFIINDGSVYPCDLLQFDEFYIGNIFENSIFEIINNINHKNIFRKLKLRTRSKGMQCNNCLYSKLCNLGCIAFAHREGNVFDGSRFFCEANKLIYAYLYRHKQMIDNYYNSK